VEFEPTTRGLKVSLGGVHAAICRPLVSMPRGVLVHEIHGVGPNLTAVAVNVAVSWRFALRANGGRDAGPGPILDALKPSQVDRGYRQRRMVEEGAHLLD
jgi:hypothetical protein